MKLGTILIIISLLFTTILLLNEVYGYTNVDEMHDINQGSIFINENEHDITTLNMINQYCLNHVEIIMNGENPVLDLYNSGLISKHFETHTCRVIQTEKNTIDSAMSKLGWWYQKDIENKEKFLSLGEEQFRNECYANIDIKELTKDLQKKICENKVNEVKNNQTDLDELYRLNGDN